jgi:hypothetical protein
MKTKLFLGIFILLATFSCKKTDTVKNPDPVSNHENMIRTETQRSLTFTGDVDSTVYTYDDNNLLVREDFVISHNISFSYQLYTYDGNLIIARLYDNTDNLRNTDTLFLDEHGLVTRYRMEDTYTVTYKYDINGYCTSWISTYNGDTVQEDRNTITSGNCVNIYDYCPGAGSTTNLITFYTDSVNTVTHQSMGRPWFGKSDVNPKYKNYLQWCTGPIEQESYIYKYDSLGRIVWIEAYTTGVDHDYVKTFTYY